MRRLIRTIKPVRPVEQGVENGLAFALWMPAEPASRGIVVLHGAGSRKEAHYDYARTAIAAGFAAITFDQRGHGDSAGPLDGRVRDDVATIATLLRSRLGRETTPVALRGSSMGGYLAIVAAAHANAAAVVSICPASPGGLRRGMQSDRVRGRYDIDSLAQILSTRDLPAIVESLTIPLLILHAEGDEVVPVEHSRRLAEHATNPQSRLLTVPGGHHRSVQHDPELQAFSLRWLDRALS